MARALFYCDHHEIPLPEGHKFPKHKYRLLREALRRDGVFQFMEAPMADPDDIRAAHDPAYVKGFLEGTLPPAAIRRIGFPWSPGLVKRTLASVGGTLSAVEQAFETGWGGTLAGGTHHAFYAEGSGFCVFNDFAVSIAKIRRDARARRFAIIDLDVHQGDGTALLFEKDPEVLTLSLHGRNNFPFRKQRSKIDIEFADKTSDAEYLAMLRDVLPRVAEFAPEFVFFQSGVDALASDALGRLSLTHEGLRERDLMVFDLVRSMGTPLVITLGGGYSHPIELTAEAHAGTFRAAAATFPR
ncbi:MAG: histone deacetylase [Bryobacteraceae bacterium]|nr:histone deacetylase [Bryobacteraceae bacterium]